MVFRHTQKAILKHRFLNSIRIQLLLLVLLLTLPALGLILYSGLDQQKHEIEEAKLNALSVVYDVAFQHEQVMESTRVLLMTLAKLPDIQNRDSDACNRLFTQFLKEHQLYTRIFALTTEGVIFSSALPFKPYNESHRKFFRDALRTKDFSVGEFGIGDISKLPVLPFGYPAFDDRGHIKAVLATALDLTRYGQVFSLLRLPRGSLLVFTDHKGKLVYRYPEHEKHVGKADLPSIMKQMQGQQDEGTFIDTNAGGAKRLYAYKRLRLKKSEPPYLYIRVGIPEETALSGAKKLLFRNLIFFGMIVAIAMFSFWFVGSMLITTRVNRLVDATHRLGLGDLNVRTGLDHEGGEIGQLAKAFDEMAAELEKRTEDLRLSEEKYRNIFENAVEGMFQTTPEGRFLTANPALAQMYGFDSPHDFMSTVTDIGRQLYVNPEDRKVIKRLYEEQSVVSCFETQQYHKDGSILWVSMNARTVRDRDGRILYYEGTIENITERKRAEDEKARLESQLLQAQKMEAIGTLAGGVAHDFNNILTTIIGYGSLLQMNMDIADPKKIYVDQILTASQKAANLTSSLLAFSRKQTIELKPYKINDIVKGIEKLLKRLLTEDIAFNVVFDGADTTIMADVTQIDQVLMNLATNARDAMPRGGVLIIEAKEIQLDNEFIQVHGYGEPGSYAIISVTDTGCGMDKKTKEKIFEPFFTTKEVGKGTGLGLSTVYGIIKQHNGIINVYSEPDKGTVFKIYLPTVKVQSIETIQPPQEIKGGNETILVAEDNNELRSLIKEVLTARGYTVMEAIDGEDAVQKFMEQKDSIDLLILDVVMPNKNGKEAYEEIRKIRPDIKTLFTSGYTGDVVIVKGINDEAVDFISKPLSPNGLLLKIRVVLDK